MQLISSYPCKDWSVHVSKHLPFTEHKSSQSISFLLTLRGIPIGKYTKQHRPLVWQLCLKERTQKSWCAGDGNLPIAVLPSDISSKAWADVLAPETPAARTDLQLRTLAAAARSVSSCAQPHIDILQSGKSL